MVGVDMGIHRRHKPLTPTAERFIQMLKEASETPGALGREREPERVASRTP